MDGAVHLDAMQLGKISAYSFVDYRGAVQLLCQGENLCLSLVDRPVRASSRRGSLCRQFHFQFRTANRYHFFLNVMVDDLFARLAQSPAFYDHFLVDRSWRVDAFV